MITRRRKSLAWENKVQLLRKFLHYRVILNAMLLKVTELKLEEKPIKYMNIMYNFNQSLLEDTEYS